MYHSEHYIEEFYHRIIAAAESVTDDFELIFINDGSPDKSLMIAVSLHDKDRRVKVVDLSRNFGHHKAMMAGLKRATGDLVFLIDVDLEEQPELLIEFYEKFKQQKDFDVIYGVQNRRKGGVFEVFSGWLFYIIINWLSDVPIPKNYLTVRLMTRKYVTELVKYEESQFSFATLTELTGFDQKSVVVSKKTNRRTTYSLVRKLSIILNILTSSSVKPLYIMFYIGLLITLISFAYILNILFKAIFFGYGVQGWPSLMVSIWFLGGLISMFIGIIGLYISRIYLETKQRPYVHIRRVWDSR